MTTMHSDPAATSSPVPGRRGFLRRAAALLAGWAFLSPFTAAAMAREDEQLSDDGPGDRPAGTLEFDPYVGQISLFAGLYAPRGWAFCQGQLLSINMNQALFSILGTTYGGNGQTTFALPDLRGRVPIGWGLGPGLSNISLGEQGGEWSHTLSVSEMPAHTHIPAASAAAGTTASPVNTFPAVSAEGTHQYAAAANGATPVQLVGVRGSSQPHTNVQPYIGLNYIIAITGVFPPRS